MGKGQFDAFIPFLPVQDLSATRDFYERELGLDVVQEQARCLVLAVGGGHLGFCQAERSLRDQGPLLSFLVADVDGMYKHLRRLGVDVEQPPRRDEHYAIYHFLVRDPDGYRLEFRAGPESGS